MKQLTCEMCGSTDLVKQDGFFVCQTCGCKYSVEEAKKMMIEGTVTIDRTDEIKNLITRAKIEIDNKQSEKAMIILDEALKKDPKNGELHYLMFVCKKLVSKNYEGDNYNDIFQNHFYAFDNQGPEFKNAIRFCKKFACFIEEDIRINLSELKLTYVDNESKDSSRKLRTMENDKVYLEGIIRLNACDLNIDCELPNILIQKIKEAEDKKLAPLDGLPNISYLSYSDTSLNNDKFACFSRMGIHRDFNKDHIFYDDGYVEFVLKESGNGHDMYIRFNNGEEEYWYYFASFVHTINHNGIKKANYEFNKRVALLRGDPPPTKPKNGGCYVATCVYGSYDCPQVWTLRRYRDNTLGATWYGRAFIKLYYAISPTLVKWFGKTKWFKKMWKGKLDRMVKKLQDNGVESTPYNDKEW